MWKNAKGHNYLKNKLGPFYIVHTEKNENGNGGNSATLQKKKQSKIVWDFDIGENEGDDGDMES